MTSLFLRQATYGRVSRLKSFANRRPVEAKEEGREISKKLVASKAWRRIERAWTQVVQQRY